MDIGQTVIEHVLLTFWTVAEKHATKVRTEMNMYVIWTSSKFKVFYHNWHSKKYDIDSTYILQN